MTAPVSIVATVLNCRRREMIATGTADSEVKNNAIASALIVHSASSISQARAHSGAATQSTAATNAAAISDRVTAVPTVFAPSCERRWRPGPSAASVKYPVTPAAT